MAVKQGYLNRGGDTLYPKTLGTLVVRADGITQFCEEGAQVNVIETIKVNGTTQTVTNKEVNLQVSASDAYEMKQVVSPDSQYAAQYYLDKNGTRAGAMINIPKDMVVSGGACVNLVYDSNKLYDPTIYTEAYVVGSTEWASDWLSDTAGGSPITPQAGVVYKIKTAGTYFDYLVEWDTANTSYHQTLGVDVTETIKGTGGTATAADAGAYLRLTLANATSDKIYIDARSFITNFTAGNGITITNGSIAVNAGAGLSFDGVTHELRVHAAEGLMSSSAGVFVLVGDGVKIDTNNKVAVKLASNSGLEADSNGLKVKINALAPSLALDSNGLKVNLDSGSDLTVGANGMKLSGESSTSKVVYFTEITNS